MKTIKSFFILLFSSNNLAPKTIMTKHDFEIVLNYFLSEFYEMEVDSIESMPRVTIKNKLPFLLEYKFNKMKKYVEENKSITIFVNYK